MMWAERLRTYARLGLPNLARVCVYRIGLKTKLHPVLKLKADAARGPFFGASERSEPLPPPNPAWDDAIWRFGWHREALPEGPPDWFANPFANHPQPSAAQDWWEIPDFTASDIKGLWELSRMDWAVAWATMAAHGDGVALQRLNAWLASWAECNPPYKGPNWKCAQEVSIRVMHLVVAAWVLGQDRGLQAGLADVLRTHLQRIALTTSYAIGQQNNHGTSEAAALFIGGSILADHDERAAKWKQTGREMLETLALNLIERDGSFSQYSVTYHRVMLDTYSLAEAWRRHRQLPAFSERMTGRVAAATRWLEAITSPETGDAPNVGANDGARLLQLTDSGYRDFRPSVQLAAALFEGRDAFGDGPWNKPLHWLDVPRGKQGDALDSMTCDDGGYHILKAQTALAVMRYPRFRFRPSQADALHVDLWHCGINLLRDGGTFSYNAEGAEWFASAQAHNTVTFDGRDQMVRLGRFLFGDWLEAEGVQAVSSDGKSVTAAAGYTDRHGAHHHRTIALSPSKLICTDTLSGTFDAACLRWRLSPDDWRVDGRTVQCDLASITVSVEGQDDIVPTLGSVRESRYYQHSEAAPQIALTVTGPATITTDVSF